MSIADMGFTSPPVPRLKLLVFESHPVQYRAPVYRELQRLCPDQFQVVYGTDQSVRGWKDSGFGQAVAWDEPLLEGYPCQVLDNLTEEKLDRGASLEGKGIRPLVAGLAPSAVLMTSFRYHYDWRAMWEAARAGSKIWIRQETQDHAFRRNPLKSLVRNAFYRALYARIDHAFYIGSRNREHLLRHGVRPSRMSRSPYATTDRFAGLGPVDMAAQAAAAKARLGFQPDEWVLAFSGKFIEKKDPMLVLKAAMNLPRTAGRRIGILMIGSGELEPALRERAAGLDEHGIRVVFTGFVNQSMIGACYLAADALMLPSQRMGETWGLVVNEALQAGCAVVVSDAVGCAAEFGEWERVRVAPVGSAEKFRAALVELTAFPRSFTWCREQMLGYSIEAAAAALAARMSLLA